jgi:uncharacterized protein (TIGR03083 family)
MDRTRYLATLTSDSNLLGAAAATDLTAAVPFCPGWTVRDVVEHIAEVYEHKLAAIASHGERPQPWPPPWPKDRDPLAWFSDARQRLVEVLTVADPMAPSWTWWPPDQTVGFWVRRMAHETAVHRVDVEAAVGTAQPIDADLALDGVDEVLHLMLAGDWSTEPQPDLTGIVEIATGGQSWRVAMAPEEVIVGVTETASAIVSGEPSVVLLWLWGRARDGVEITGQRTAAERLRKRLALATQ